MVDQWLFGIWPYVAMACVLIGPTVRGLATRRTGADQREECLASLECFWSDPRWRRGVVAILAGHLVILVFPAAILSWNRSPARLLLLESALLAGGVLAVVGLIGLLRHNIGRWRERPTAAYAESTLLALVTLTTVSGLLLAVLDRWASSWAAVVWPSYLAWVARMRPDIEVLPLMPFLVRLHVAGTLALLTLLPFTSAISLVLFPLSRAMDRLGVQVGHSH
jgi:nitrate reductase gamma subunit